jgi:hypothetical protein
VAADRFVDGDVLVADFGGPAIGGSDAFFARTIADRCHRLVERPFQIDRGRPGREQLGAGALQRLV